MIARDGFGQSEIKQYRVEETERGRKEERHLNSPTAENAADCWSKNKPETKRRTDQAHAFRAVFLGGDVGDVGLRSRDVAAGDAVENATGEKHPECRGESEYEETDAGADDRKKQHRPPAVLVRQAAEYRREDQLHDRVGREEQSDRAWRGVEDRAFGVERQHRNHNAEADEIDEDGGEDDDETRAVQLTATSAQTSVYRKLSAAGDQQRDRDREQRHRIFETAIVCKEVRPVNAGNRCDHYARDQESADARQKSEQDENAAKEFRERGEGKPKPCRAHKTQRRVAGGKGFETRTIETAEHFLRAVRDE